MIEDYDEDEDEGPAPSSGEFLFLHHVIWAFMNLAFAVLSGSQKHHREH